MTVPALAANFDGLRAFFQAAQYPAAIGEENAHLLGSFLVARITQAAMSRQEVDVRTRVPFFLYIDEFHHFITPSLSTILSGTRKYGLGAVLAHQEARQVKSRSEDVFGAILSNASTRVMFRVGDHDARFLAEGLSFFETSDLMNLGTGEAIARIDRPDYDFNLRTHERTPVDDLIAARKREAAVARSRAQVGRPRQEIEALLQRKPAEASIAEQDSREQPNSSQVPTQFGSSKKSKTTVERAPVPGRGGNQHKYLQSLVRRLAEDRGFTVTLEV